MNAYPGLTSSEAARQLLEHGRNELPGALPTPLYMRFAGQFANPVIYILLAALLFDLGLWVYEGLVGIPVEFIAILAILILNAVLGVWQESKSEAALARLRSLAAPRTWVYRDKQLQEVPSAELVPEDCIRLEAGERVPADASIVQTHNLSVDESILTGESLPVDKGVGACLLSGSLAVRGSCIAVVQATGMQSNMGKLASMLGSLQMEPTPLERRLDVFGRKVAFLVAGIAVSVFLAGIALTGGRHVAELLLFAVALAVAAVPEGLPAVMTMAMAFGMERMASRQAVVRRMTAVEALGSVTVIATDKTGTLTENRMDVEALVTNRADEALRCMALANDAPPDVDAGDPLDIGLLRYAQSQGVDVGDLRETCPRESERSFDAAWKYMRVSVRQGTERVSMLKGAPEVLLERCQLAETTREQVTESLAADAAQGFRTIAFACGTDEAETALEWLGYARLWDPPRPEVPGAIAAARKAGVAVRMVTGDHPATAAAIAERVGIDTSVVVTGQQLDECSGEAREQLLRTGTVFARVRPEHKLELVQALKFAGEVVAVTGDGVNDAPALKAADIGVAMGQRGSDVSREVADLVLLDDNFETIVHAIEEGRSIYENIQKFLRTLFSTNLTELVVLVTGMAVSLAVGGGATIVLPLTAVQILWMNLVTDSLPALAIATDRNTGVLAQPPRPGRSPLLDRGSLVFIVVAGVLGGIAALALLFWLPSRGLDQAATRTAVFSFVVWVQMVFVLPARRQHTGVRPNPWVWAAVAGVMASQVVVLYWKPLAVFLGVAPIDGTTMAILAAGLLGCWLAAELLVLGLRLRR